MTPLRSTLVAAAALLISGPALAQSPSAQPAPRQDKLTQDTTQGTPQGKSNAEDHPVNSAPGVQGPPDTRTGPSTKGTGSAGAASGGAGTGKEPPSSGGSAGVTQPAQDSSGVKGAPGNKNGPAAK